MYMGGRWTRTTVGIKRGELHAADKTLTLERVSIAIQLNVISKGKRMDCGKLSWEGQTGGLSGTC
jgi:hypothetical protein